MEKIRKACGWDIDLRPRCGYESPPSGASFLMKKQRLSFERVDWINTVFLLIISLLAVIAAPIYLWNYDGNVFLWSMFAFYCIATGMSITLGYHRLFSHMAFQASWPVRLITLIFGVPISIQLSSRPSSVLTHSAGSSACESPWLNVMPSSKHSA